MSLLLTRSIIGAALFFVLGCVVAVTAARLPMGSARVPGPGAFPLGIGVSLIVLSICLAVQSLRGGAEESENGPAERWGTLRVAAVCGLVALYIFALPIVGFTVDTALLMTALYAVGSGQLRIREVAAALLTTAAIYALFVAILEVRLPQGSLWGF